MRREQPFTKRDAPKGKAAVVASFTAETTEQRKRL